jgi:lipase chaperone LimK
MVSVLKMTKKKKILIIVVITAALAFIVFRLIGYLNHRHDKAQEAYLEKHYIFDKNFRTGKINTDSSSNKYFPHGIVTAKTLDLFRFLEQEFAVKSLNELSDHFNKVKQYLNSQFDEPEAQRLFEIYQKYMECQIKISNDSKYEGKTPDPKSLLSLLYTVQNFRREKLGKETADALFGREVKESEYLFRKALIIGDNTLYGKEKENRLQKLKGDMWDGEVISMVEDRNPHNRYHFKMQLYQKDMSEMDEKARKLKVEEFRKEFFSKEEIKRLNEVDKQITQEKQTMERHRAAEREILNLKNITQEEKDKRIKALQDKFFGKEAEAFRRREAMRKGLEK